MWGDCGRVLTTRLDDSDRPTQLSPRLQARGPEAGVPVIPVHAARRACASLLVALDVHPRVAMAVLRHRRMALTTDVYSQASSVATRDALRRIDPSGERIETASLPASAPLATWMRPLPGSRPAIAGVPPPTGHGGVLRCSNGLALDLGGTRPILRLESELPSCDRRPSSIPSDVACARTLQRFHYHVFRATSVVPSTRTMQSVDGAGPHLVQTRHCVRNWILNWFPPG